MHDGARSRRRKPARPRSGEIIHRVRPSLESNLIDGLNRSPLPVSGPTLPSKRKRAAWIHRAVRHGMAKKSPHQPGALCHRPFTALPAALSRRLSTGAVDRVSRPWPARSLAGQGLQRETRPERAKLPCGKKSYPPRRHSFSLTCISRRDNAVGVRCRRSARFKPPMRPVPWVALRGTGQRTPGPVRVRPRRGQSGRRR